MREAGETREAGSPWRGADRIMLEQMWMPRAPGTHLGDGPALGTGDEGGEGGWRRPWLRFLAGLEALSNRNEGERSPRASGGQADVLQERGAASPADPEIWGGQLVEMRGSCSAAANDLQIKVFVSIESFTRTNIHPKINFPFFLFL